MIKNNELIIVDDDIAFRNILTRSMEKKGFNVESFGDFHNSTIRIKQKKI